MEDISNKIEIVEEEHEQIEGYAGCNKFKQKCLTDCKWPFLPEVISPVD